RISELLQKGEPPFITGSISYSNLVRGVDALVINAAANPNREDTALRAIYTEAVRAARHGCTISELDRAKARLITSYDNYYKQKDKISNDDYLNDIQGHFLDGEPLVSVDFEYQFAKSIIPGITADEISDFFRSHFRTANSVMVVQGQEEDGIKHLSENEARAIIDELSKAEIAPYQDAVAGESLIEEELKGSPVIKTLRLQQFDAVEWTLGNGARVVYRKADYEKDNVILTAYSNGGTSLYETEYLPSATMLSSVISMYGLGDFDNITLQKMLAGKKATASVSLGQITEGINGNSTPKDFETMMQLAYLRFAKPRFDREAHDAIMARYAAFVAGMVNDPSKIMQDSVSVFLTNYSPRTIILNNEMLGKVDFGMIEKIYRERFANVADFVFFIVGNVEEEEVRSLAEKYIGSLPSSTSRETFLDRNVRPPKGRFVKDIRLALTVPKATVFISHSADLKYTPFNNVSLKVINGILDLVFTEKVREEAGGTYGVSVSLTSQKYPWQNASGLIMFDCDPEKAEALKKVVYDEIGRLVKNGPSKENLQKSVSNMLKTREESRQHNNYWSNVLYSYYFNGINVDDPANFDNILEKLTVKDIKKVAGQFFGRADVAEIVFRPR
ncbi:MAG: insulinase family protein, partial [Bacteroidales bacterium]|nr:insulinase family protein [Bacteroidales bacterium]